MTHWRLDIIVESDVGKNVLVYIFVLIQAIGMCRCADGSIFFLDQNL